MKKSKYDIIINTICIICLIVVCAYLILSWNEIPNQIPGHYNVAGEIDRMTSKNSLIILYIVAIIMYGGLTAVRTISTNMEHRCCCYRRKQN